MAKKILLTVLFIIIGLGALLGLALLVDGPARGMVEYDWAYKIMDFTKGFGYIIGQALRFL